MTNAEVARVLERIAVMLEIEGANPFRVRAYREGARVIGAQGEAVARAGGRAGARSRRCRGIGKDLAQKIRDLVATGTTPMYDELRARIPDEVVGFTELQGLGPKRVKTLFETLGIRDRAALEAAAKAGRAARPAGLRREGRAERAQVARHREPVGGPHAARRAPGRWRTRWPSACAAVPGVTQVELAGSFRRRRETVGDLDLLVTAAAIPSA